jgi:hypothetical protein
LEGLLVFHDIRLKTKEEAVVSGQSLEEEKRTKMSKGNLFQQEAPMPPPDLTWYNDV